MQPIQAPPPDLELQVRTHREGGQTRLSYTLHSPRGAAPFSHQQIEGPVFDTSPEEFHRRLIEKVEKLADGREVDGALALSQDVEQQLASLGRDLWDRLFNDAMRLAYRRFRDAARTLLIITDEPWIPWEMIKPFDDDGDSPLDDPFLAERFELTRWLAGKRTVAGELVIRQLAFVGGVLPRVSEERKLVVDLADRHTIENVSPVSPSVQTLVELLEKGGLGLLHVAAHGTFDPAFPDEAGIPLIDGSVFRPTRLDGPTQTQISKDRPLVFLNVCNAGQQAWSWTGRGGWADRWVCGCGCGAIVGPQWKVKDEAAFAFARGFYAALEGGEPLGRAVRKARQEARNALPGDPSWLAYTVYGHPNARAHFGDADRNSKPVVTPDFESTRRDDFFTRHKTSEQFSPHAMQPVIPAASTNLRIKKQFSDLDRDKFIEGTFEVIASYFESALRQLEQQNPGVEARPKRIDREHFTAAIYVQGEKSSSCRIWLDRAFMRGSIAYASQDSGSDNSYNESLRVEDDGYSIGLRALGLQIHGARKDRMSKQEAAEYLWEMLVGRLQ